MVYGCDERPWEDESLPWDDRVESLRQRMQEWELSAGVDRLHIRIVSTEEAERAMTTSSKESQHDAQISLLNERFAGLEGHLFGRDGTNGAFGELRTDIKALMMTVDKMHAEMHAHNEHASARFAQYDQQCAILAKDLDAVGDIARDVRDSKRDTIKRLKGALIAIGGTAAGAALWAGIQVLL